MDLFFANIVCLSYFIGFITFVEKQNIVSAQENVVKAFFVVACVLFSWCALSFFFVLFIGWFLPVLYPKVFLYKAMLLSLFLFIYWPYKMGKAQLNHIKANKRRYTL
ncbi:hypothetical protein [Thalassotalea aquiviva]|uniref:hypothetical protein n=1 Tax=Thalassotalea aquiviva TaxID=3242415 RepID=UPI00352AC8FC